MGALPKKKLSRIRRGKRMATKGYNLPRLVACSHCGKLKMPHVLCPHCGYYNERMVFEPKEKTKVTKVKET